MTGKTNKEKGHFRRQWNLYVLVILSLGTIGYIWFAGRYESLELKKAHKLEIQTLQLRADSLLQVSLNQSHVLIGKAMGQAIASMDYDEKNQYFEQMIKYKGIKDIIFESLSKTILASSNKGYFNYSAIETLDISINYQNTDTQSFYKEGKNIIAHPVIFDGKIDGTLIIVFPTISVAQLK